MRPVLMSVKYGSPSWDRKSNPPVDSTDTQYRQDTDNAEETEMTQGHRVNGG